MYGYEIPSYARAYLRDWRRYDRLLRLRWSLDHPGWYILERKTRFIMDHPFEYETDAQVQYKDGYRKVFAFAPKDIRFVQGSLELCDVQRMGGGKAVANRLDAAEDRELELMQRAQSAEFEAIASDHYDRIAWDEKRRVAMSGLKG